MRIDKLYEALLAHVVAQSPNYGDDACVTIRGFVLKFEEMRLLGSQKYRNRVKYRVRNSSIQNAQA